MLIWRALPSANIVACLRSLVERSKEPPERREPRAAATDPRQPAAKDRDPPSQSGYSH